MLHSGVTTSNVSLSEKLLFRIFLHSDARITNVKFVQTNILHNKSFIQNNCLHFFLPDKMNVDLLISEWFIQNGTYVKRKGWKGSSSVQIFNEHYSDTYFYLMDKADVLLWKVWISLWWWFKPAHVTWIPWINAVGFSSRWGWGRGEMQWPSQKLQVGRVPDGQHRTSSRMGSDRPVRRRADASRTRPMGRVLGRPSGTRPGRVLGW